MRRWLSRVLDFRYEPRVKEDDLEEEDGSTSMNYILLTSIPEENKTEFLQWVEDNDQKIRVSKTEKKLKEIVVESEEVYATDVNNWDRWYIKKIFDLL